MASLAAQSSTHLSDGKVIQNKSYQTLNAMPSTHSNAESHNEKAAPDIVVDRTIPAPADARF